MNIFSAARGAKSKAELRAQFDDAAAEFECKAIHHFDRSGSNNQLKLASNLLWRISIDGLFPACSIPARGAVGRQLRRALKNLKKADRTLEFRSVTIILKEFMTSDEQTVADLRGLIIKARRILSRMSGHYNAMIEIQVSSNVRHADGGKLLCPHVHAMIYGHDIGDQADKVAKQVNARLGLLPNEMKPVHVSEACLDAMSLARAAEYPFKLPATCKTLYLNPVTGKTNQHQSKKGDRMIRYERQFEILSRVPLRQLIFAGGNGRHIKTSALRAGGRAAARISTGSRDMSTSALRLFWKEWRVDTKTLRFAPPTIIL